MSWLMVAGVALAGWTILVLAVAWTTSRVFSHWLRLFEARQIETDRRIAEARESMDRPLRSIEKRFRL